MGVIKININTIVNYINERLAGEQLLYSQLLVFLDGTIDDINQALNSNFPAFSEFSEADENYPDYNFFPDRYIRTVNNIDVDTTPYMYYGRLSFQDVGSRVIPYSQITEAMIKKGVTDGKLTKETPKTKGKTSMGKYSDTAEMDYIIVAVPTSKNYTVTKDNGLGGKMAFDEETAGANGIDITINSVACKLYGEMLLSQGEMFLYVD